MNTILIFQFSLIISSNIFNTLSIDMDKIPSGYYHGGDKISTGVFVKIESDKAIADFILKDKYPRELLTDTLYYRQNDNTWQGKVSEIYQKQEKYYVRSKATLFIFGSKKEIRIKTDENYYKYIDEYKNLAVLHMFHDEYQKKNGDKANSEEHFQEILRKYNLSQVQKHENYLIELKKLESELSLPSKK